LPKSEEHVDKLKGAVKIAKQAALKKVAENSQQLMEKLSI
jgi:hypothetical protein